MKYYIPNYIYNYISLYEMIHIYREWIFFTDTVLYVHNVCIVYLVTFSKSGKITSKYIYIVYRI